MRLLRCCAAAFSVYSRIPVPSFTWKDEEMKYMLCFFPWVGAVLGVCLYLWRWICAAADIGEIGYVCIGTALPVILTGGIHADGYMDTMDARHSYQPRERKLEIMKDPHVGAFGILMLGVYGLLYAGALSVVNRPELFALVCCSFFFSRCLSGIGVVTLPAAKQEGMLRTAAERAQKIQVRNWLFVQAGGCMLLMLWLSPGNGMVLTAAAGLTFAWYARWTGRELQGTTGDTAGCFLMVCERNILLAAALLDVLGRL